MKIPMFIYPGNAVILKDYSHDRYVGLMYAGKDGEDPVFATVSEQISPSKPREYVMMFLAETLEQGLRQKGRELVTSVVLREANCAIITGDGKHYAVAVDAGNFQYACPDGNVTDLQLETALIKKMRCPDRR